MWIAYAFSSAFFAGITAVLSKIGIKNINSNLATAIRTTVVLFFSWIIVFVCGAQNEILQIQQKTLVFLVLSGAATGASWLCYFKALQLGSVSKVMPIDKSSTILSMILAFIFLKEEVTLLKIFCITLIAVGTYMMIEPGKNKSKIEKDGSSWFIWAVMSAVFASLTSILGKVGISDVDSDLGTAIRTVVVLIMAWLAVFVTNSRYDIKRIDGKSFFFLVISGFATGLSWLSYYKALKEGPASIVVPIDKLSILLTMLFSCVVLKEEVTNKSLTGLLLLAGGTLLLIV